MKIVWGIYEGLCDYDGDARSTEFFVSREDAEQAVKTLIRKRVASNVYPMCCEVQKYILFESYDEWFESAKEDWGFRTP